MSKKTEEARIKAIPGKEMKAAIVAMNEYLGEKELDLVLFEKLPKEEALANLLKPIEASIESGDAENLPSEVIAFYNDHLAMDEEEEKKQEKAPKTSNETKKAKAVKKVVEKDKWGCRIGCGANKINLMISEGTHTKPEIIEEVGTTTSRLSSHLSYLSKKEFFVSTVDKYKFVEEGVFEKEKTDAKELRIKKQKEKAAKLKEKNEKKEAEAKKTPKTEKKETKKAEKKEKAPAVKKKVAKK